MFIYLRSAWTQTLCTSSTHASHPDFASTVTRLLLVISRSAFLLNILPQSSLGSCILRLLHTRQVNRRRPTGLLHNFGPALRSLDIWDEWPNVFE